MARAVELKLIVVGTKRLHEFCPRSTLRFIVIYKTDGGLVAIVLLNICFGTAPLSNKGRADGRLRF